MSRSLLEVVALDTGKILGHLVVNTGTGGIRQVYVAARNVLIEDTNDRTLAYSLDSGERVGQQFGKVLAVDMAKDRVAIANRVGAVTVLDRALHAVAELEYPHNLVYAGFDGQGKRLLVLTGEQEVFVDALPE